MNGKSKYSSNIQKSDKQSIKNYRPVPVCGKILERLIYDSMLKYCLNNNLISENQSGFKPGDINRAASGVDLYHFRSFFFPDTTYQTFFSIIFSLGSQGPGFRVPGPRVPSPRSWVPGPMSKHPESKVLGPRSRGTMSQGP